MKARIMVVDDDERVRDLLHRGLSYEGYTVDVARDGKQGLDIARERPPDVVILDIMMPGMDGLEVCRRLRSAGNVPILLLTAKDAVSDKVTGLQTGADDYLVKPFAFEELVARVQALLRRRESDSSETLRCDDLVLDTAGRTANRGDRPIELTATEFELLALFLRNPGRVLTRSLIMERVWGYDFGGESNVLDVYIGYLRSKLEAGGEKRLIHTTRGVGFILKE